MAEKMSLDEAYEGLKRANITDEEQRRFVIDSRSMLPAHEIAVVISYLQSGWSIQQIKQKIVPIMEHIDEQKTESQIER